MHWASRQCGNHIGVNVECIPILYIAKDDSKLSFDMLSAEVHLPVYASTCNFWPFSRSTASGRSKFIPPN